MKTLLCSLAIACGLFTVSVAPAAPAVIDYQGFLRDTQSGLPLNGPRNLVFILYGSSAGPDTVWSETHSGVNVDQGVFSVQLGSVHALTPPMFEQGALFLEVSVDGQIMSPRTQLVSVPYALSAQVAQQAARADTAGFSTRAAYADSAGNGGGDPHWVADGSAIMNSNEGNVNIRYNMHIGAGSIYGLNGVQGIGDVTSGWYSDAFNLRARWPGQDGSFGVEGLGRQFFTTDARGFHVLDGYHTAGISNWYSANSFSIAAQGSSPDAAQVYWGDGTGWKTHFGYRAANGDFVPRFTFVDYGFMGIGNTSPTAALDVSGTIRASGDLYAGGGTGGFSGGTDLFLRGRTGGPGRAIVDVGQYLEFNYSHDFPQGVVMNGPILMHDGVTINGNLCVTGSKNRIVETPYGVTRMNSVESAEAWFTKSGEGQLANGRARVDLPDHFKATVTISSDYPLQVDVTFYGPHGNWYVERDLAGFTIVDPSGGNAQFSWRASARQKGYETWDLKTGSDQGER